MKHNSQSGNVLFYILIAVALLAALTFAVAQSGRGSGETISKERARLIASEIIEYSNVMSAAVTQTRLRGFNDTEISFDNNTVAGYTNPNCTENICNIFNINGAGVNYQSPPAEWLDSSFSANAHYGEWLITGRHWITGIGTDGSGSNCGGGNACAELTLALPYIKEAICIEINKLTEHGQADGTPFTDSGNSFGFTTDAKFAGSYNVITRVGNAFSNLSSGCIEGDTSPPSGSFTFYKVLIAR